MTTSLLEHFVITQLFAFLLIFTRIGTGIMTLPGFGEAYVPARYRLYLACCMGVLLVPAFGPLMPEIPSSPLSLAALILAEVLIGLFIGMISRLLISAIHVAGTIIANESSLSMATVFDPSQGGQSTVIGNMMTLLSVVLFFVLDIHHIMLNGLADSYTLFPPGSFPSTEDMSNHLLALMDKSFAIAVQLSAPHIIFSLMFYLCSGIVSRMVPVLPVFFVMMPLQILTAFFLLLSTLTMIMMHYNSYVEESLRSFLDHNLEAR